MSDRTHIPKRMNTATTHEIFNTGGRIHTLTVLTAGAGNLSFQKQDATVLFVVDTSAIKNLILDADLLEGGLQIVQTGTADCLLTYIDFGD